jgi:hypothetical protein
MEDTLKKIIHAVRSCRLLRPMTLREAKTLCLALTEVMLLEQERTMKATQHLVPMPRSTRGILLSRASVLLQIRFLVGSKKERTAIILGCFDAHVEFVLKPRQRDPPAG